MTTTAEIVLVFGMMLVTFGVRYPVLAILGRLELPPRILNALRYVPVAVLTAITVPAVLAPGGGWSPRRDAFLVPQELVADDCAGYGGVFGMAFALCNVAIGAYNPQRQTGFDMPCKLTVGTAANLSGTKTSMTRR